MSIIKLKNVSKFYQNKKTIASGFNKVNLELDMGEFVVITGESGSGKSTLLNVISGLDSYEEGEMYINGEETSHYTETDYEEYRRKYIGNIFQHFNLINSYTVYQNIELVLTFNGYSSKDAKSRVLDIINTVGLKKYKNTKVSKLSGGQKQRVAIARALAKDTPIIVADEPTGNLDVASAKAIMKLLHDISKDKLVVIVTHNYEQVEEYVTRKISMHDGKIIEDKKVVKTSSVDIKPNEYESIRFASKLKLALRNVFNIKTKFVLLFLVYFFLTIVVFSEYSNLRKIKYDQNLFGYNEYFRDTSKDRVIINKKDKSSFSDSEIDSIRKMDNIKSVVENDITLDTVFNLYGDDMFFNGIIKSASNLDTVDMGRLPQNKNEVVLCASEYDYYLSEKRDEILNSKMSLQTTNGSYANMSDITIVGVKYLNMDEVNLFDEFTYIYVHDGLMDDLNEMYNSTYSNITVNINNKNVKPGDFEIFYTVESFGKLKSGEVYIPDTFNNICKEYNCVGSDMTFKVSNIYYQDEVSLKVKNTINMDNYKNVTGLKEYNRDTILINSEDYKKLYDKDTYQMSVFLDNDKVYENTIKKLNDSGYNTIMVRETLTNEMKSVLSIVNLIRSMSFVVATVALFFISYFIIKVIFKSRNIYFSTIRILGATKDNAKSLLNIELLADINIAYIVFLILVLLVNGGLISSDYIKDMVTFFRFIDYVIVYFILIIMSLLISHRYSRKLFKDSVMKTYREDV